MTKTAGKSMKISIDSRIVRAFEVLPNTFTASELAKIAGIPKEEFKCVVYDNLERMVSYGLVHKEKLSSNWYKDHEYEHRDDGKRKKFKQEVDLDGFERWLLDYYKRVKDGKDA
jgi:hypothetical protein